MVQIIVLANGISIGGANYPENSITFKIKIIDSVDNIEIKNTGGHTLFLVPFTDFINSSDTPYASADDVITELRNSYS